MFCARVHNLILEQIQDVKINNVKSNLNCENTIADGLWVNPEEIGIRLHGLLPKQ